MSGLVVVLDSCVLYPAPLRDFLMHLAVLDIFKAQWTERIHAEWIRNLLADRPDLTADRLDRTRQLMNRHARDCVVDGYEDLIDTLTLPDANDRHVLAAAIYSKADVIVTFNLKDFPSNVLLGYKLKAQHPDDFLVSLIMNDPKSVWRAAGRHRLSLQNPPKTPEEYLSTLMRQNLPNTCELLLKFLID